MIADVLTLPARAVAFAFWFAGQVVRSSGAVLVNILTPGSSSTPRVVRMSLGTSGDYHVAAISVLITLTPGTLTLGVAEEPDGARAILVHSMYHRDAPTALADLSAMDRRMVRGLSLRGRP